MGHVGVGCVTVEWGGLYRSEWIKVGCVVHAGVWWVSLVAVEGVDGSWSGRSCRGRSMSGGMGLRGKDIGRLSFGRYGFIYLLNHWDPKSLNQYNG